MQAFILAAGLGTRLQPLTNHLPKALVQVQGQPLLKIAIDNLVRQGVTHIVVNVHHFADMVCNYLQNQHWDIPISISFFDNFISGIIGQKKMVSEFAKGLIFQIAALYSYDEVKMVFIYDVADEKEFVDTHEQLIGWENKQTGEAKWVHSVAENYLELAFDGIALIEPQLLNLLPPSDTPYSIIPSYLEIAKNHSINYFELNPKDWLDVGKPQTLSQAQQWKLF